MSELLVIDIGGTKTNISYVKNSNPNIEILSSQIIPTNPKPEELIKHIASIYKNNTERMSLSLPGKWDKNGILQKSYNLPGWINYPFITNLKKELNIKNCVRESDVICGALGEWHMEKHNKPLLYINLGTGVSAAFINKDGQPFKREKGGLLVPTQEEAETITSGDKEKLASWVVSLYDQFTPEIIVLNGGLTYDKNGPIKSAIDTTNQILDSKTPIVLSKLKEKAPIYGACLNRNNFF